MPDTIRPVSPSSPTEAYNIFVELLTEGAGNSEFCKDAQHHLAAALIKLTRYVCSQKKGGPNIETFDAITSALVRAVIVDAQAAPILGAYIQWGRMQYASNPYA